MLNRLNKSESSCVSAGGWTCDTIYQGRPFYKAAWRSYGPDSSKSSGACFYGENEKDLLFYRTPDEVVGIIQKPVNHWDNDGNWGGFDIWTCLAKNPTDCVFKEK